MLKRLIKEKEAEAICRKLSDDDDDDLGVMLDNLIQVPQVMSSVVG